MEIFEQTFRNLLIRPNLVGRRVFLMRAPQIPAEQAVLPYVVFFPVAPVDPKVTQRGPLNQTQRVYQISIFDSSQSRALAIADSYRAALNTLHGNFENVHIGHCLYLTQTWVWEPETEITHVIQEYSVMFNFLDLIAAPTAVSPERSLRK